MRSCRRLVVVVGANISYSTQLIYTRLRSGLAGLTLKLSLDIFKRVFAKLGMCCPVDLRCQIAPNRVAMRRGGTMETGDGRRAGVHNVNWCTGVDVCLLNTNRSK
jgi:hypothetical protein